MMKQILTCKNPKILEQIDYILDRICISHSLLEDKIKFNQVIDKPLLKNTLIALGVDKKEFKIKQEYTEAEENLFIKKNQQFLVNTNGQEQEQEEQDELLNPFD